jgi:hypothetical protein
VETASTWSASTSRYPAVAAVGARNHAIAEWTPCDMPMALPSAADTEKTFSAPTKRKRLVIR